MKTEKIIESRCKYANESYSCTWNIKNFDVAPYMKNRPIYGPSIKLGKKVDSIWQLIMFKHVNNYGFKSLKFRLSKAENNTVWDVCKYTMFLKSKDGAVNIKYIDGEIVGGEDDSCEWLGDEDDDADLSQNSADLMNTPPKEKQNKYNVDLLIGVKDLIVVCDISYTYLIEDLDYTLTESCEKTITQDLLQLYESRKFCDIILCADGKKFPAHRNILSARSSGFDLLLQDTSPGGQQQTLDLDIPQSITELMVMYLYTGSLPADINFDTCSKLENVAIKYGINNLEHYIKVKSSDKSFQNVCLNDEEFLPDYVNGASKVTLKATDTKSVSSESPHSHQGEAKSLETSKMAKVTGSLDEILCIAMGDKAREN